jgi:hypothetical protein
MRESLKTISLSLIPAILIYIGKTEGFFIFLKKHKFLENNFDASTTQFWCFLIGCLWAGLAVPVQFANTKNKLKEKEDEFNELLKFNKDIYFKSAKEKIKKQIHKYLRNDMVVCDQSNNFENNCCKRRE